ncbi:hypothetical protein [Bacillus paramycoides]|uniref:hypothetical protein n=1 Tax=Bacillus paramycoides TaxID=2026194 RepID=UPI002E1E6CE7|nr:hypothetical protein [Bacillus paramycoides]
MKVLKNSCIAIGANIIFCIALYIYRVYMDEIINPVPGRYSTEDTIRDLTYIFFAFIIPLTIGVVFSIRALRKEKYIKILLVPNLIFSLIFLTFTGGVFILFSLIELYIFAKTLTSYW